MSNADRRGTIAPIIRHPDGSWEWAVPQAALDAWDGITAPYDALTGRLDPMSPEATRRSLSAAGFAMGAPAIGTAERAAVVAGREGAEALGTMFAKGPMEYDPPHFPQRPFKADYPNGAPADATGKLQADLDGRPLQARFIAGRTHAGRPDTALGQPELAGVVEAGTGRPYQAAPRDELGGRSGGTYVRESTGRPVSVVLADDLHPEDVPRVLGHETGHVIDQIAGTIPVDGLTDELARNYDRLATGNRWSGGKLTGPADYGYPGAEQPRELMVEAVRAYMADPNYVKREMPATAARIREHVNGNPDLNRIIQFNQGGVPGAAAGTMAGSNGPVEGEPMPKTAYPPLPSGFVLDEPSQSGSEAMSAVPPLPAGFEMMPDSPRATEASSGQAYAANGVPVGGDGVTMPATAPQTAGDPKYGGVGMNVTAGANEATYGLFGAPVDVMRGAMNLGVRGFNAATGAEVPQIPDDSFGGSRWLAETAGKVDPRFDPANTAAGSTGEKIARGVGQGVAGTVLPAGAVAAAGRAGVVGPKAVQMAEKVFGRAGSGKDALVGAVSGAGSAAGAEAAPEGYEPIGSLVGGLVGGGVAAVGVETPTIAWTVGGAAKDFVEPMTAAGRERMAGRAVLNASDDPAALRETLNNPPAEIVSGSKPTTGQVSGDMGVLAAERASQSKFPAEFQQRRADQNTARLDALGNVQPEGAPEAVSKLLRRNLKALDDETAKDLADVQDLSRGRNRQLGQSMAPEDAGEAMRDRLQSRRDKAVERENRLWAAIDPDNNLALAKDATGRAAKEIADGLPKLAKPMGSEEAAIFGDIRAARDVIQFREMNAFRSRVSEAMADERSRHGKTASWARLSRLRGAIEDDLESAVTGRAQLEEEAVLRGQMKREDTLVARLEKAPTSGNTVYTSSGQSVPVGYEVVDASALRTSNGLDGRPDAAYPSELQPRDRSRAASDAQIATMARTLQPERLGASSEAGTGAPIVGADGIVESGNGRVLAVRRAYGENGPSAKAYRDYLAAQGYDTAGMKEPILIRRRAGEMSMQERARFAQEANGSSSMSMSASEQAAMDATRLTPETLRLYRGGDLSSAENRDFARAFLGSVADRGQEGSFVTGGGGLSLDGANRMRNALLSSAYGDPRLMSALADEGDENIRAFGRALGDISGDVARLRSRIKAGEIAAGADLSPGLMEAANIVQRARAGNVRIADLVSQADAFNPVSNEALQVLKIAYGDSLAGRLSRERLNGLMRHAIGEAEQQVAGDRLFGGALDANAILQGVRTRYGTAAQSAEGAGFAGVSSDFAGDGALRSGGGRSGNVPPGAEGRGGRGGEAEGAGTGGYAPAGGGRGLVDPRILEEPELDPNFTPEAKKRLDKATDATRQRADTFDNPTLGRVLTRPADHASYTMESARVASRVFQPGTAGFDRVQAYRKAAGDKGMAAVEAYAIDRLRQFALNEDGTVDATKLARWQQSHRDALRALPELEIRIGDADRAARAMEDVALRRKAALDDAQKGVVGKLLGKEDPQDITATVGGLFGRQDSVQRIGELRIAIGNDKEALQGLRKAAADFITTRFIGNTEAATSGRTLINADQFQTFVKQNRNALRGIFSADEVQTMQAVADDLQRANRSLTAVKIPGQSNTVQDALAVTSGDTPSTILGKVVMAAMASGGALIGGSATGTTAGAMVGAGGAAFAAALRQNGIQKVDELVRDALLDPNRARMLVAKVPAGNPAQEERMLSSLAKRYVRAAMITSGTVSAAGVPRRDEPKRSPPPRYSSGNPLVDAMASR